MSLKDLRLPAVLLLAIALVGCEETVPPTLDTGRPFTLWGGLNPATDVQTLRVVPIQLQIDAVEAGDLDAMVTSTDLASGDVTVWSDSVVVYESGRTGFVAFGSFQPDYGANYHLAVERSDGATSEAFVQIPPYVEPLRLRPNVIANQVTQQVLWPEAPGLNAVEVVLLVRNAACGVERVELDGTDYARSFELGWEVSMPYHLLFDRLSGQLGSRNISLARIDIRALVTSEDWEPPFGFSFDDEIIVQPGSVSNVDNGFGYIGGAYPTDVSWIPEDETLEAAGFRTQQSLCGN